MKKKKSDYEDLQKSVRSLKTPQIETWDNQYTDRDYRIEFGVPECTCICPKTGLPDFVTIKVSYLPDKVCVELKSFKFYIVFFRDVGIFHEHLINRILDDIVNACDPKWARVEGTVSPRGGITTNVEVEYMRNINKK